METQPYPLEIRLGEFESKWNPLLLDNVSYFLPNESHPEFHAALTEFIRVDMELRYDSRDRCLASDYLARFPALQQSSSAKSLLVFEEFRLRNHAGDSISADRIASEYNVSTALWPAVQFGDGTSSSSPNTKIHTSSLDRCTLPDIGERFANFRIIGRLGEGSFGFVMLAQQDDLAGRLTVLKFVPPFSDEHSFLARLQHSNIVPIYSIHGNEKFMAICMPFMGVATLQDLNGNIGQRVDLTSRHSVESRSLIETTNRLKEKTIENTIANKHDLALFQERNKLESHRKQVQDPLLFRGFAAKTVLSIAEGLAYAHEHGIVHGDLKPANILISDDYQPVLLDFHLASNTSSGQGSHVGGTLAYMAPEHFDALISNQPVDARTDVYSMGVILFELVTGRFPHARQEGSASLDELKTSRETAPVFSRGDIQLLGHDLTSIVAKCLDPIAENRYQNGSELVEDLRAQQQHLPLIHAKNNHLGNRIKKWARRHPRLSSASSISVFATLLIVALTTALFLLNSRLDKIQATNLSTANLAEFERIRQPLATYTYFDREHFERAIDNANDAMSRFGWTSIEQFQKMNRLSYLSTEQFQAERAAAAELHFWVTEAYQRIALEWGDHVPDRHELLEKASIHSKLAYHFQPSVGLKLLDRKIEYFRENPNGSYQIDSVPVVATHLDRTIIAFLLRHDEVKSQPLWLDSLKTNPTDCLDWLCLGQSYYRSGKYKDAKACFTVCVGLEPDNIYPRIQRAMASLADNTDLVNAKDDLLFARQRQPKDLVILQNLALVHGKLREFEAAKLCYDQAIELGTDNTRVWYLRSRVNQILGNSQEAKSDYAQFMSLEPATTDSISWRIRGTKKIKTDAQAALQDLRKSLEIDPRDPITLVNLANVYSEQMGDLKQATAVMDQLLKLNPGSARNFAYRGVLHARNGDRMLAINDARRSLKLDRSAKTLYLVSGIFAQTSKSSQADIKSAFHYLKAAVSRDPLLVSREIINDPDIEPLKALDEMEEITRFLAKMGEYSRGGKVED